MEKIYIVTPCYRQQNLEAIRKSIDFSVIHKWYIVYDTSRGRQYIKIFRDPQIIELECSDFGIAGHPQRNFAIDIIEDGFIYFVDDDNIVHPDCWPLFRTLDRRCYYTWDQLRNPAGDDTDWALFTNEQGRVLKGNVLKLQRIDTAQIIFPKCLIGDLRWAPDNYKADGVFIESLNAKEPAAHVYIPQIMCYYNYIT